MVQQRRFLGIFVNPVAAQFEGIEPVFDNCEAVGATAVALSPRIAGPARAGSGVRFPDLHVDGFERLLGRPLWGKSELLLDFHLAYEPNLELYATGPYRPLVSDVPGDLVRTVPQQMVEEATRRGMEAHVQLHPFLPPQVRPEDQPVTIDGSRPAPPQVAMSACLNSPAARTYALAIIEDTLTHFPTVDGLFIDWAEYGAYRLEDHFTCFCSHCEHQARTQGFDWERMVKDVFVLWDWLHHLTPRALQRSRRVVANPSELLELLTRHPGWVEFLRFKAETVTGCYRIVRQLLDSLGHADVQLSARGWPPPWNRSSGMNYHRLAEICHAVTPKLFTFDYSALPRWYGQTLLEWNPALAETEILDMLVDWLNLPDDIQRRSFAHYHIPAPDEYHPARIEAYRDRVDEVIDQVAGRARCYPFAHAYLPEAQWKRMLALLRDSAIDGIWVQMYAYLTEPKLRILGQIWR